jgi:hypothetical protein
MPWQFHIGILGQHEEVEPEVAPYFGKVAANAGILTGRCGDVPARLTPCATPDS